MSNVALYLRISRDAAQTGLGVERQEQACRELAARLNLVVAQVYTDNDLSAWSGVTRPAFEQLGKHIEAGIIDGVIAWHIDRLTRTLKDFIVLRDWRRPLYTVQAGGQIDFAGAGGNFMLAQMVLFAEYESNIKAERLRLKHSQLAQAGKWTGQRCFGYNADGSIVESEAEIIRSLVARFLAGESLRSLVLWLNANEVPTIKGGTWRSATLRAILPAARLSGQREHTPRATGRSYGFGEIVAQGEWQAIISPTETQQIRNILSDPTRRVSVARTHLLSGGILFCGRCGSRLNRRSDPRTGHRYQCIKNGGTNDRCGSLSIMAEPVEWEVSMSVLKALLDTENLTTEPVAEPDRQIAQEELAELNERSEELAAAYANGEITMLEWRVARSRIEERKTALAQQLSTPRSAQIAALTAGWDNLEQWWLQASVEKKRAAITAVLEGVHVRPGRGEPWERLEYRWKR